MSFYRLLNSSGNCPPSASGQGGGVPPQGKWTDGGFPLGYNVMDKKLIINPVHCMIKKNGSASCQDAACRVDYLDFGVVSSLSTATPGTDVLPVP